MDSWQSLEYTNLDVVDLKLLWIVQIQAQKRTTHS